MSSAEKNLSWILKGGLWLVPFIPLIITRSMYFPFITGKNFTFRILIELLSTLWIFAALKFPRFRPRSSALAWAIVAFTIVLGLATLFGLSPQKSFWSNFERMEGYITILHLLLYFLLLTSVFTTERDWSAFFHTSLAVSVAISLYGVLQLLGRLEIHQGGTRLDGTLGNATYLAAYLLFHLFFLIWFFLRATNLYARFAYGAIFLLEAVILYHTATRGAILGFFGGLVVLATILAVAEPGRLRRLATYSLGVLLAIPILFFLVRDTSFVRQNFVLARFATISLQETTTQSRMIIWSIALQGWRERPILGWGQESFVYLFSKYYDPRLWRQEPWFDRAHNIFLDWMVSGGTLGFAAYLGIYGTGFWLLARSWRRGVIAGATFSALGAVLAAHAFQNLFVFDNLASHLLFFAVLGFIHTHARSRQEPIGVKSGSARLSASARALPRSISYTVGLIVVVLLASSLWAANVKPMLAARAIIDALRLGSRPDPRGKVDLITAEFRRGIALNTFGTTEVREQASQTASFVVRDQSLADQDKQKFLAFVIAELEEQVREAPADIRAKAFLASAYATAGRADDALATVHAALEVSSRRQQFYFVAAEVYLSANQYDQAIQVLGRAYELDPAYDEAVHNLATALIVAGREAEAESLLQEHFGQAIYPDQRYTQAYSRRGNFEKVAEVWQAFVRREPTSYAYHVSLGATYARLGRVDGAIREIEEAMRLEPAFRPQGEQFIQELRSGKIR